MNTQYEVLIDSRRPRNEGLPWTRTKSFLLGRALDLLTPRSDQTAVLGGLGMILVLYSAQPKASQTLSAATVKTSLTRPVAPSMKVKKVSLQEGQSAEEAGGADAPAGDGAGEGDGQPYFGQFEIPAGLEDDEDQAPCTHKLPDGKCEPRGCQDIELSPQAGLVLVLFAFIPAVASVIYWLREPSNVRRKRGEVVSPLTLHLRAWRVCSRSTSFPKSYEESSPISLFLALFLYPTMIAASPSSIHS
eukprot:766531-Hanusia_phi.AAC.1